VSGAMDEAGVQLMANIAAAMAADAHASTRAIEGHLSDRLVELYDGMKHAHARLGGALASGNTFKLVGAYEEMAEVLALASIGMDQVRKAREGWDEA
jgi:hypothetical protein